MGLKDFQNAKKDLDIYVKHNPTDITILFNLCEVEYALNNFDVALNIANRILSYDLNYNKARSIKGACFYQKKLYQDALKEFDFLLNSKMDNFDLGFVNYLEALVLVETGELLQSLKYFDNAIKLHPNETEYISNRGIAKTHLNDYKEAEEDFSLCIKLNPFEGLYYGQRGFVLAQQEKYDQAIADLNKSIEIGTDIGVYYFARAVCYLETNQNSKVCSDLKKAEELGFLKAKEMSMVYCEN